MKNNVFRFLIVALAALLIADFADAQVHGSGTSDSSDFDVVIDIPPEPSIGDLESHGDDGLTTQINVDDGGSVGRVFGANAGVEVNISGGTVGSDFRANFGSEVNISGGTVENGFIANSGSEVNVSGGSVGGLFGANFGSEVNISGGTVGNGFSARPGSEVNISGGTVGPFFIAASGSEVNISGGTVGSFFDSGTDSDIELFGGEFKLNGVAFTESTITLVDLDVLSGTLTDGSAFIFSRLSADRHLNRVTLTSTSLPVIDTTPIVINTAFPDRPSGLRAGQTLTLQQGGELGDNFELVEGTLNVEGGSLGDGAGVVGGEVNVSGGAVGHFFHAESGSVVNISGGTVGVAFYANAGSEVNISGGTLRSLIASSGSAVNISGGTEGFSVRALSGSEVNISGGTVNSIDALSGSAVNFSGTEFLLNGMLLDDLVLGEALMISDRNVTLSGLLADGTTFDFDLNESDDSLTDFFSGEATLTVTLAAVAEPPLLGDANCDGTVDFLDIGPFIAFLSSGEFKAEADVDESGAVDFLDIGPFIAILSGS